MHNYINLLKNELKDSSNLTTFTEEIFDNMGVDLSTLIEGSENENYILLFCSGFSCIGGWSGNVKIDNFSCKMLSINEPELEARITRNYRRYMTKFNGYKEDCKKYMRHEAQEKIENDIDNTFSK